MSKVDWDFPALCLAAAIAIIGCAWAPDDDGMNYHELRAYDAYLEVCREQGIVPEPPQVYDLSQTDLEDFDTKR